MKNKTEKLEEMKAMIFSTNPFGKAESGISEYGDWFCFAPATFMEVVPSA